MDAPSTAGLAPPSEPTGSGPGIGSWLRPLAVVALATVGMWLLSAVALVIYTSGTRAPERHVLEIPAGTSQLVAAVRTEARTASPGPRPSSLAS